MGKRLWLFLAVCLMAVGMTFAQKTVTGKVIDGETGEPVIGASVLVQGTTLGKSTDIEGNFTIQNVPNSAKNLRVTFVGMKEQIVAIKPKLRIYLQSMSTKIDETVVVAFGKTTKEAFTGSATTIKSEDIAQTQSTNALDAIRGKSAGVQMTTPSGQPGTSDPTIVIRGITSIYAGNSPLIVVDGAVFHGGMNELNSADIESVTVLKDAASNALYGARGANGVIMVTTKSAKRGQEGKITLDAKWGSNSRASRRYKTINSPAQYYEQYYQALYNYAVDHNEADPHAWANNNLIYGNLGLGYNVYNVPAGQYMIGTNGKLNPNATLGNTVSFNGEDYYLTPDNAWKELYQNGLRQEYNLTAQNASQNGTFYMSMNYLNNEGITRNSGYERINGRLKADSQIKSWLKVGANLTFTHYETKQRGDDGTEDTGSSFSWAQSVAPIYPLYVRDGNGNIRWNQEANAPYYDFGRGDNAGLIRSTFNNVNPMASAYLDKNQADGNTFNGNAFAEIRFLKDFKFTSTNTVNLYEQRATGMTNAFYGQYANLNGELTKEHARSYAYSFSQVLDWTHRFGLHDVAVMVGHESDLFNSYSLSATKQNMFSPDNLELNGAITNVSSSSSASRYNTEGFFGRAMYNYDEKYFGSVSYRRDGSSRFHPSHRWGGFGSIGGAWIISKEEWFPKTPYLNYLKIKASYGENGNDNIGNYLYTNTYRVVDSNGTPALLPSVQGNKNITWEKSHNFNAGFEFEMFKSRLRGDVEYFYRKTTDMLFSHPNPTSFGWSSYYDNVGDMRNQGVEISLDGDIISTKDLTWTLFANATAYSNKIKYLSADNINLNVEGYNGFVSSDQFYGVGKSLFTYYLPKWAGVNKETGAAQWWKTVTVNKVDADGNPIAKTDKNGDPIIDETTGEPVYETEQQRVKTEKYTEATDYLCGTALPDLYGGFGTSFTWKGFDFAINFSYQIGGKVYDSGYASLMGSIQTGSRGSAMHADLLNAWTPENANSNIPRYVVGDMDQNASSDRFLVNGSYLAINNINIGYTLPTALTRRLDLDKVRVYFSADNVALWSKRQGLDPRQSIGGGTSAVTYSPIRTLSGGISVTF